LVGQRIYSPSSGGYGGAVWPEHFVIRWVPRKGAGSLSLSIRAESGIRLWPEAGEQGLSVPADLGELDSEEARQVLLRYRQSGRRGPLTLVLVDSDGNEDHVQFSTISEQEAETLAGQLKTCDQQSGLMQHICRSYYFRQIDLYTEAAEEYEEALKLAPESIDLRLHLIAADQLTGNYARAQELIGKLPRGTELP
jgi:tetratricopeptide (TPR) repeat protein